MPEQSSKFVWNRVSTVPAPHPVTQCFAISAKATKRPTFPRFSPTKEAFTANPNLKNTHIYIQGKVGSLLFFQNGQCLTKSAETNVGTYRKTSRFHEFSSLRDFNVYSGTNVVKYGYTGITRCHHITIDR